MKLSVVIYAGLFLTPVVSHYTITAIKKYLLSNIVVMKISKFWFGVMMYNYRITAHQERPTKCKLSSSCPGN